MTLWLGVMGASAQSNKYDLNHDGDINITDVIELVNYILDKDNGNDGGNENDSIGIVIGEAIDLGLPSGVKWASCNIGATKPEEYGGYYAWGETEEKEYYSDSTYVYYQNGAFVYIGDISGTDDVQECERLEVHKHHKRQQHFSARSWQLQVWCLQC